jgi:pilus assembly protein FimV
MADQFDDLQFVDDSLLDSLEKPGAEKSTVEDDDEIFEYLSDADEAATKLDLARAYFEMGDSDGAREILEEVLREGNEDQIKDASTLLSKL